MVSFKMFRFHFSGLVKTLILLIVKVHEEEQASNIHSTVVFLPAVTDEDTVKRYYAKFEERFYQTCEKELLKINTFYSGMQTLVSSSCRNLRM